MENGMRFEVWKDGRAPVEIEIKRCPNFDMSIDEYCRRIGYANHDDYLKKNNLTPSKSDIRMVVLGK
jgi:hypothetical protein